MQPSYNLVEKSNTDTHRYTPIKTIRVHQCSSVFAHYSPMQPSYKSRGKIEHRYTPIHTDRLAIEQIKKYW